MVTRQQAAAELLRRRTARESLVAFSQAITIPGAPVGDDDEALIYHKIETGIAQHHRLIMEKVQACLEAPHGRLMLFFPPGSAKTTYAGVVATAWALGRWNGYKFIGTSYSDKPAHRLSRRCRSVIDSLEYRSIFPGVTLTRKPVEEWDLSNDSSALWSGILGSITSARADAILIDDPVSGRADAESPVIQRSTLDAYNDDVKTRLKPGGSIILIMTRWDPNDLAGSILPEDWAGESGAIMCRDGFEWEVVCVPAKAERLDDPLGRKLGEPLWPEWFDAKHWANFESNAKTWASLYQQRPRPETGNQFEADWIQWYDPKDLEGVPLRHYGASDYAVTKKSIDNRPDWTEHGVIGLDSDGDWYVRDWWFGQVTSDISTNEEINLAKRWGTICWWGEAGVIENAVGPMRTRNQRDRAADGEQGVYYFHDTVSAAGDKISKVASFRGRVHARTVYLPRGEPWAIRLRDLLLKFRGVDGDQDDAVDVLGILGRALDQMTDATPTPDPEAKGIKPFTKEWLYSSEKRAPSKRF